MEVGAGSRWGQGRSAGLYLGEGWTDTLTAKRGRTRGLGTGPEPKVWRRNLQSKGTASASEEQCERARLWSQERCVVTRKHSGRRSVHGIGLRKCPSSSSLLRVLSGAHIVPCQMLLLQ